MKLFKKIATLALALTLCAGIGAFAAACDNTGENSNSVTSEVPSEDGAYKFKIVNKDGSAATGYSIQLCSYKADGVTLESCYQPVAADENGLVSYDCAPSAAVYEIHVLDALNNSVEFTGETKTPAAYNTEAIVITLK